MDDPPVVVTSSTITTSPPVSRKSPQSRVGCSFFAPSALRVLSDHEAAQLAWGVNRRDRNGGQGHGAQFKTADKGGAHRLNAKVEQFAHDAGCFGVHHDRLRVEEPAGLTSTGKGERSVVPTVKEGQFVDQFGQPRPAMMLANGTVNAHAGFLGGHDMNFPS